MVLTSVIMIAHGVMAKNVTTAWEIVCKTNVINSATKLSVGLVKKAVVNVMMVVMMMKITKNNKKLLLMTILNASQMIKSA